MAKKNLGVGLDIGTMNIIAARKGGEGISVKRMRDAFLTLPANKTRMLKLSEVNYVEREDDVVILGDAAMEMANVFGGNPRRPLAGGLISAKESDALGILKILISNVLGEPQEKDEICYFSVPAPPLDQPDKDIIYHQGIFERIVAECGFDPWPSNEAMAIVFSECALEGFSGLTFSFGSGMTNVALALNTTEILSFSVQRGGDWIDEQAAKAIGMTQTQVCALKESGIDLMNHQTQAEEAIALYYKAMINFCLDNVAAHFQEKMGAKTLPKAIPIVVSGGTSQIGGFLEFFNSVWKKKKRRFPIEISEVRQATDPLNAVSYGMLVQAMQEYEDD